MVRRTSLVAIALTAHRHYAQAFTRLGDLLRVRGPTRAPPLDGIYEQPAW